MDAIGTIQYIRYSVQNQDTSMLHNGFLLERICKDNQKLEQPNMDGGYLKHLTNLNINNHFWRQTDNLGGDSTWFLLKTPCSA